MPWTEAWKVKGPAHARHKRSAAWALQNTDTDMACQICAYDMHMPSAWDASTQEDAASASTMKLSKEPLLPIFNHVPKEQKVS